VILKLFFEDQQIFFFEQARPTDINLSRPTFYTESTTTSPCCLARYLSLLSFWKNIIRNYIIDR